MNKCDFLSDWIYWFGSSVQQDPGHTHHASPRNQIEIIYSVHLSYIRGVPTANRTRKTEYSKMKNHIIIIKVNESHILHVKKCCAVLVSISHCSL